MNCLLQERSAGTEQKSLVVAILSRDVLIVMTDQNYTCICSISWQCPTVTDVLQFWFFHHGILQKPA